MGPENEEVVEQEAPEIPEEVAMILDFITRAEWNISTCKSNLKHLGFRLNYLETVTSGESASDSDKSLLEDTKKAIEEDKKNQAEQERFLAYCKECLAKEQAKDETAS